MVYSLFRLLPVLVILFVCIQGANASEYRIVTAVIAPWSMPASEDFPGPFVEIIREVNKKLGNDTEIEVFPWARAQEIAKREKSVIIFPVGRIKEKENLYQWIYPIRKLRFAFITADGRELTEEQARDVSGILVHAHAPPEMILEGKGFTNLVSFPTHKPNFIKLMRLKRMDAWFTAVDLVNWLNLEYRESGFTVGRDIVSGMLYMAGSPDLPKNVIEDFQRIISEMRKHGEIKKIFAKYQG